ncbi:MAG: tetratricopeptide repeat protein, partial [Armatimonadetes bacterium]|nr:tetratricopeptide repeat protein [Armatimonadota bacterium]NIO96666.1 tetratricopeptide repeat protein [Armatimonadota bacterium]
RGDIYAHYGQLDRAIENYSRVLDIDPNFGNALWKLAAVHVFKREYAKAE